MNTSRRLKSTPPESPHGPTPVGIDTDEQLRMVRVRFEVRKRPTIKVGGKSFASLRSIH
jgi:hypothetical protein